MNNHILLYNLLVVGCLNSDHEADDIAFDSKIWDNSICVSEFANFVRTMHRRTNQGFKKTFIVSIFLNVISIHLV